MLLLFHFQTRVQLLEHFGVAPILANEGAVGLLQLVILFLKCFHLHICCLALFCNGIEIGLKFLNTLHVLVGLILIL